MRGVWYSCHRVQGVQAPCLLTTRLGLACLIEKGNQWWSSVNTLMGSFSIYFMMMREILYASFNIVAELIERSKDGTAFGVSEMMEIDELYQLRFHINRVYEVFWQKCFEAGVEIIWMRKFILRSNRRCHSIADSSNGNSETITAKIFTLVYRECIYRHNRVQHLWE